MSRQVQYPSRVDVPLPPAPAVQGWAAVCPATTIQRRAALLPAETLPISAVATPVGGWELVTVASLRPYHQAALSFLVEVWPTQPPPPVQQSWGVWTDLVPRQTNGQRQSWLGEVYVQALAPPAPIFGWQATVPTSVSRQSMGGKGWVNDIDRQAPPPPSPTLGWRVEASTTTPTRQQHLDSSAYSTQTFAVLLPIFGWQALESSSTRRQQTSGDGWVSVYLTVPTANGWEVSTTLPPRKKQTNVPWWANIFTIAGNTVSGQGFTVVCPWYAVKPRLLFQSPAPLLPFLALLQPPAPNGWPVLAPDTPHKRPGPRGSSWWSLWEPPPPMLPTFWQGNKEVFKARDPGRAFVAVDTGRHFKACDPGRTFQEP